MQSGADMLSQYDHDPFQGLGNVRMLRMDRAMNNSSQNHTNEDHESWVNSRVFKIQGINNSEAQKPPPRRDFQIDINNYEAFKHHQPAQTTHLRDNNVLQSKGPVRAYASSGGISKPYANLEKSKADSLLRVLDESEMNSQQNIRGGPRMGSNEVLPNVNLGDIENDFKNLSQGIRNRAQIERTVWDGTESWKTSGGWANSNLVAQSPTHPNGHQNQRMNDTYATVAQFHPGTYTHQNFGRQPSNAVPHRDSQQQVNFGQVFSIK